MHAPVIDREQIAEQAAQDAREWIAAGRKSPAPMNRYPALSREAALYDVAIKRALGSDDEDGRTA